MNSQLHEKFHIVQALGPIAPSTSTPLFVSLKGVLKFTAIISVDNGAAAVTGCAITVEEATAVAGTGNTGLALTKMWAAEDTEAASGDLFTETAVTSDTFTTFTTANKNAIYVVEVDPDELSAGFDCIALTAADTVNAVVDIVYILELKYARAIPLSARVD